VPVSVATTTFSRVLIGIGSAAVVLPALAVAGGAGELGTALAGVAVAGLSATLVLRVRHRPPSLLGGVIVAVASWLLSQAGPGAIDWFLAALLGLGVALAWPAPDRRPRLDDPALLLGFAGTVAALVGVAAGSGPDSAWAWGSLTGFALIVADGVLRRDSPPDPGRPGWLVPVAGLAAVLLLGAWIGANSPSVSWFGTMISHGPRDRPEVAITFDDGPNTGTTLAIAHVLDAYGAKGTFFSVGKAVVARPDISRALLADGQLLANHSYLHDSVRWLDPRYPELTRAQHAIQRETGVCPTFYRPPHGQHTPFVAYAVHANHMRMIGWDVSAGDWATSNPQTIADRVLRKVRGGSIIDLHDGLDGRVNVDRRVLVQAMPLILDGLRARGLHAVRLDQLLGIRGYRGGC
jgi:peptidoglycan/xylan/chitin deacetylase (PgdA/CDA1 family)